MRRRRSPRSSAATTRPMSVMIPVNTLARLLPDALVDFQPVDSKHARLGEPPAAMGVGEADEADMADRLLALADQDRRAVDQHAVDQVGGEEGGGGGGAAFDQQIVDVMKPAHRLGLGERRPTFAGLAAGEQGATWGPFLEPRQPHVELRLVGVISAAPDED